MNVRQGSMLAPDGDAPGGGVDLTPMLDVVFIVLIFFIVAASFVRESGIESNAPDNDARPDTPEQGILVRIDKADRIGLDDRQLEPDSCARGSPA